MLTPVQWDLAAYPGFTFNPLLQFYEDAGRTQPFDLSGYSAQMTVGNGALVLSSAGPGLTLGGALGTVQALATAAQTAGLPLGDLDWFLSWTSPGGEVDCPAFGVVSVGLPVPARA